MKCKILFVVNVDWSFLSHRLPIAQAAVKAGYEVHIATGLTDRLEELEKYGLIVHPLSLERGISGIISTMITLWQMVQVMRLVKPDLVHLVTIKPVLLGGIAARLVRVPFMVAAVPGLGFVFLAQGLVASLRRHLVGMLYRAALGHKKVKVIFQNTDDQAKITKLAKLAYCNIVLIRGSGVALDSFKYAPVPDGVPVVMLAARLLADKGVREFVEAANILKAREGAQRQQARFVLVGEPDLANPASLTQTELDAWQQEGDVEIWGHRVDMADTLSAATIVVLPSYREGLPKVLIEAAACGRAVVTTDVPGCRDAIEPGETGLLVPAKDATALADAIESLLTNPEKCVAMGQSGRRLAEQAFDVNSIVQQHLAIYDELLAKMPR